MTSKREMYYVADELLGKVLDEMIGEDLINQVTANQVQNRLHHKIKEHLEGMTKR